VVAPPPGRRAFFVGDLVDRGPRTPDVLRIVMAMVADGSALCVAGNHDVSCVRWIDGKAAHVSHGLAQTAAQLDAETPEFRARVRAFLDGLTAHLWVDGGRLAVAHAGVREDMIGRSGGKVRAFALYGDTDSKAAADGLPMRYHWALNYQGETALVYGHTPVADAGWVNNTLCIDTGCCFGGKLTALRWPERETVSVPAREVYALKGRPFGHPPARTK
jgi:Calcineurin-like phosphoesterase